MQRPIELTVWSDIGCPWATLSLHTLHAVASGTGRTLQIKHRSFPLELFNRRPTPRAILDSEIVAIAGLRPELDWRPWQADPACYPVTTLPALEAVHAVARVNGVTAGDQMDTALRHAFYAESRCISVHSVILDVAAECSLVDERALAEALAEGIGRREVYTDWRAATSAGVQGSPQLVTATASLHNPGAAYHWTAPPGQGVPRLDSYDEAWAETLFGDLERHSRELDSRNESV